MLPSDLSTWLHHNYGFPEALDINLLRSYTNDVYLILSAEEKYILKVYGAAWRYEDEIKYEIDLLNYLERNGLRIAKPIEGKGKEFIKRFATDFGDRFTVLYEYAAGEKPKPPFDNRLYYLFGETIGRMHELSTGFSTVFPRKYINLDYLIDQSLQIILPQLKDQPEDFTYLRILENKVKDQITVLSKKGLDWGPIHGDATLDNLHIVENKQIILYDFDSGGPGWRASDLQGWAIAYPEYREKYTSFIDGYRQVRTIKDQDIEASWYLSLAWDIWGMKIDLENRILKQGQIATRQYLTKQIEGIRKREAFL